jgi:uncharacterized LabA/DUF88 family protein
MAGYRYRFYIDGFNVYNAILDHCPQYLWLNYYRLAQNTILSADTLSGVTYFSAYADWEPAEKAKHQEYVFLLKNAGVQVTLGRFKIKRRWCELHHHICVKHEEKQTDVNIAVAILSDAARNLFDRAIILSADTDLVPVVRAVREVDSHKEIGVMTPVGRESRELAAVASFRRHMTEALLAKSQFPAISTIGGHTIVRPPPSLRPPQSN